MAAQCECLFFWMEVCFFIQHCYTFWELFLTVNKIPAIEMTVNSIHADSKELWKLGEQVIRIWQSLETV